MYVINCTNHFSLRYLHKNIIFYLYKIRYINESLFLFGDKYFIVLINTGDKKK